MLQVALAPGGPMAPSSLVAEPPASPQAVRWQAADLVALDRLDDAERLTADALLRWPDSEDVLVIRALVCECRLDWVGAASVLQRLLTVQGSLAPAQTWCHWVRVLRCLRDTAHAREALSQALLQHPQDTGLLQEALDLGVTPPSPRRRAA